MRAVMALSPPKVQRAAKPRLKFRQSACFARRQRVGDLSRPVRWRHGRRERVITRRCCLGLEREGPVPHARQGWTSLFGAGLWRTGETKKARSVVALSRVLRLRAEYAGFASGCRSKSIEKGRFPSQAAGGPLVPLPTDRHTATGT